MKDPHLELDDIQGNVLQGYGFPEAAYVSVEVKKTRHGRGLLAELRPYVTPATQWDQRPPSTLNIAISHRGLRKLGVSKRVRETFPHEFRQGMARRAKHLGDVGRNGPHRWQKGLRENDIDVLVMLQATSRDALELRLGQLKDLVAAYPGVRIRRVQRGRLQRSGQGWERENFGFRDGFSQPAVRGAPGRADPGQGVAVGGLRRGWRPLEPGEFVLGYPDEDGVLPMAPLPPFARNGTFMVYRKLEQNVPAFDALVDRVARRHFDGNRRLVAAKLAGRWQDGTPLMLHPNVDEGGGPREVLNDFRYSDDPMGRACPLGAHVRRANPRDGLPGGSARTRRHRILRRGIPYAGRRRRGLIFVCFNASIARQFEVVNGWLNDGDAFGLGAEPDVLAGARRARRPVLMTIQGDPPVIFESRRPLVYMRGGEYLFLPSIGALATLADDAAIRR